MAEAKRKSVVSGSVSAELKEAVESYRWANRMTVAAVLKEALELWAKEKGVKVTPAK